MGYTVENQVDTDQMFSISKINKERMEAYGIKMSIKELRAKARVSMPFTEIYTGDPNDPHRQTKVKIFRYIDFVEVRN